MLGLLLFVISVLTIGAGISYESDGVTVIGFLVLICCLYEAGRIR